MNSFLRIRLRKHVARALITAGLLTGGAATLAGQSADKKRPVRATSSRDIDSGFNAFMLKYEAAVRDYDDKRIRAARTQSKDPDPPHPAKQLLAEARALADKDSGGAMGWIVEHLTIALDDGRERASVAQATFERLVAKHADESAALHALEGLKGLSADLGEETTAAMAQSLHDRSTIDEVRAEALFLRAWLRSQGGAATDPKRWEDAEAMYQELLYTFPRTRAGREVSGILIAPVEKELQKREREWVDALMKLQAAGKPPSEWPPQPVHELALQYQPIAAASHHTAQEWVNKFYPAYQQVERQGVGLAYAWLVNRFGEMYGDGPNGPWNAIRLDLLTVLYRQFPTDPWVFDSVRKLLANAESLPAARVEPAMQSLLEKNQDSRVRAAALFVIAQSVKSGGDAQSYQRAMELFTRIRDEFPDDALRQAAEGGRAELANVLPGARAPASSVRDAEGRSFTMESYRGRVVLLDCWNFDCASCLEAVPARAELVRKLGDKPFSLVGVDVELIPPNDYHDRLRKAGIFWRTARIDPSHPWVHDWWIRRQPTTILVDKDGIIRARDLAWPELAALAAKLADEAQAAGAGDGASGGTPKK